MRIIFFVQPRKSLVHSAVQCTLHTAQCPLHTAQCTMHSEHCKTAHCTLLSAVLNNLHYIFSITSVVAFYNNLANQNGQT